MKLLFIILLNFTLALAQPNLDSLIKSITSKPDTTRIRLLTEYCWQNRSKAPNLALRSGQEALKIAEAINNKGLQAKATNLMGVIYRNIGNYDKALSLYKKALQLAEQSKDSLQIAYSYNNIGGIYRLEGNNALALDYILKALKFFERINDKSGIAFCTINIGLIYKNQENYLKSLEYLNYTVRIRDEIKDRSGKALALNLIAEVYFAMNEINVALKYYSEVEKEYYAVDDKKGLAAIWNGIGGVYFAKGEYNNAIEYRMRALDLCIKINYLEGQVSSYNGLADALAKMNNFTEAEKNLIKAKNIAVKLKAAYLELDCYRHWADFSELKKDYKQALFYNKKYIALKDSIMSQENIALVGSMEAAYKSENTEKQNAILLKDVEIQKKRKNYLFVIAALVLILSAVLYSRYRATKVASEKLKELNTVKDKFFRIIAHDLKTPFNTILGFLEILKEDFPNLTDDEKLSMINEVNFSAKQSFQLLENLLLWSQSHTGNIEFRPQKLNVLQTINDSISILNFTAKSKSLVIEINCPQDLEIVADEQMLKTIIRNLVSNGIKFTEEGKITVNAQSKNDNVFIAVKDSGVGMDSETKERLFQLEQYVSNRGTRGEKGTGLGLIVCKEFVEKHKGKIWVESEPGKGSEFIFTLTGN